MKENRVLRFHRKLSAGLLLTMFLIAATQQTGKAQVLYGSIVGSVTDSSGAAIQGAEVQVTQKETNETREATTNEAGGYTLSTVVAGTHTVSISKIGFSHVRYPECAGAAEHRRSRRCGARNRRADPGGPNHCAIG